MGPESVSTASTMTLRKELGGDIPNIEEFLGSACSGGMKKGAGRRYVSTKRQETS